MENKEISIKDIVIKAISLITIVKKNIILLLIIVLAFAGLGYYTKGKNKFSASSTIMLKSQGATGGGLMSLATQFGLGGEELISFDKFKGIALSQSVLRQVLLSNVKVKGKSDLIGHHIIEAGNYRLAWKEKRPNLANVNLNEDSPNRDTVMVILLGTIKNIISISEDKAKLITVAVSDGNEDIAYAICNTVVKKTIEFFANTTVGTDVKTKENILERIDSIKTELYQSEQQYSNLKDNTFQTVKTKGLIDLLRVERKLKILNEMYIEATKQYEILNFKIANTNTGIQVVDYPRYPLDLVKVSVVNRLIMYSALGFIIGSISIIGFVLGRSFLTNLKAEA